MDAHPAAECFRLMDDEELAALAADIQANGQRDPIIVGRVNGAKTESIVDGRNRYAACERIGIPPKLETIEFENDDEVRAFVRSRSERRNLTKGQMAMGVALLYPEGGIGGRGKSKTKNMEETSGFTHKRLQQARAVLRHSCDLAHAVRDGSVKLDEALAKVKADQAALETTEAKLARLKRDAPDLADLVTEDRMKVNEAVAALDERIARAQREQQTATTVIYNAVSVFFPGTVDPEEYAQRLLADVRRDLWPRPPSEQPTPENLEGFARVARAVADQLKKGDIHG